MNFNNLPPEIQYLVDTSKQFDQQKLTTLDTLTTQMMSGKQTPDQLKMTNNIWETFKQDQNFWLNTDFILQNAKQEYTKFYTLVTLEDAIQKRWNTFPSNQKEGLKKYIIDLVIKNGANPELSNEEDKSLQKCNSILISILKYEWNTTWQSFIPDICAASRQNENLCKNNLKLLRMLSEEIFDYSKNSLTSQKKAEMKKNFESQFQEVFTLCQFIAKTFVENPTMVKFNLIQENLETLYSFLSWIPLMYIYFTDLLDILTNILSYPNLRASAIKCLTEVVLLPIANDDPEKMKIQQKIFQLYQNVLQKVQSFMPCDISLIIERDKIQNNQAQTDHFDEIATQLSLYFTSFYQTHLCWMQTMINTCNADNKVMLMENIRKGLTYVVMFNELQDETVFKICSEFWNQFTDNLISEPNQGQQQQQNSSILNMGGLMGSMGGQQGNLQSTIYPNILTQLRKIIISRMARPNEVIIKVEDGEVYREEVKDTENQALYQTLRSLLINLSKLDWEVMKHIMTTKLNKQLDGTEWSWDNINSLSWAIGSISGTLPDQEEKSFLISAIRTLLNLCDMKKGKQNKAVVASNIMYVVGQYPKFLKANWNFLKTVVKKLFEFMREPFPGVMEMAVNTFVEISKKCKEEFIKKQFPKDQSDMRNNNANIEPYIYDLIRNIREETELLDNSNKYTFYESLGYMISAEQNQETQAILINQLCDPLFQEIQSNINFAQQQGGEAKLLETETIDRFIFILKVQEKLAFSIGYSYAVAFQKIFDWIMQLYQFYSQQINGQIQQNSIQVIYWHTVKQYRKIKKHILSIMHTWLAHCLPTNPLVNCDFVVKGFIIPFQQVILVDYIQSHEQVRDYEMLQIYEIMFQNLAVQIGQNNLVPQILKNIFDPTLPMIQADFNSFPEIREKFFYFLKAVVNNSMEALFNIPSEQFKTMIDCVIWASKHQLNNLFMIGLEVLLFILKNVNTNPQIANQFYQIYYMNLLKDVLEITTDGYHKSGFSIQYQILALMISIVDSGSITNPVAQDQGQMNSKQYVYNFLVTALSGAFNTISKQQTETHITNMFNTCQQPNAFKIHLRDYLINLQQYSEDFEHMYEKDEKNQILQNGNNNNNGQINNVPVQNNQQQQ